MPAAPPLTFEESVDAKIARALQILINGDTSYFANYYGGRARWIPPLVEDDLVIVPDCMIQIVPESGGLNRLLGNMALPAVNARILMWEPDRTEPYRLNETETIENRIVHMEKLLESGSIDEAGDRNGTGKLLDPDSDLNDPPVQRFLNVRMPKLVRSTPVLRDLSAAKDRSSLAMIYPLIITFDSLQNRVTRRRND